MIIIIEAGYIIGWLLQAYGYNLYDFKYIPTACAGSRLSAVEYVPGDWA